MGVDYSVFEGIMKQKGMKIADVARGSGVPYSAFTDWKANRYTPKIDKLHKIAEFLGVTTEYLVTGKDPIDEEEALIARMRRDPVFWNNAKMLFFMRPADQEYIYRSIELVAENADKKKETASA